MKALIVLVLIGLTGWVSLKFSTIYKNKSDLADRVSYYLEFVDENSFAQVKQGLIDDAAKTGITLEADAITIDYSDTDKRAAAQNFVAKLATFQNKQVAIQVRYIDVIAGFKIRQEINRSKIKQIKVRQKIRPEYEELLK